METKDGVGAEDVALTPVSLNPKDTSNINDNYLSSPTLSNKVLQRLDKRVVKRTFQTVKPIVADSSVLKLTKTQTTTGLNVQSVSCLAVSCAHSVCSQGLP